ncbi:MAG: DUF3892 domain-containing protein [Chlamydiales bacterium]
MKKAYRYDDEIIFYFDAFNNKFVAKGGSLAWRLNNPGLLLSHSLHRTGYSAIGAYHKYAIFSHLIIGKDALRAWICSTKYLDSPLIEIAKYYFPSDPTEYLTQLCVISNLSPKTIPRSLSAKDFDKLLKTIQKLAGFSPENEHQVSLLPKITARFYSAKRKVEFYLAGYEDLLTKSQAIKWIETHKLDAVIVHKSKGEVYLRSRPGHHFDQIRLSQKDYGIEKEFKDAVKEVGEIREGQCIWGFVNGILNTPAKARESVTLVCNMTRGEHIWYLTNDACIRSSGDAIAQKSGHDTETVKFCAQFFKMLVGLADQSSSDVKPPVIVITHSQGALIAHRALERVASAIRQHIRVFTFGGAALISPDASHPESHNYFSTGDLVFRLTSCNPALFLLELHEGTKTGLTVEQVIAQMIQDDADVYMTSQDEKAIKAYWEKRQKYYEDKLHILRNVTVLEEHRSGTFEHAFINPIYQNVLKKIIHGYQHGKY